MPGGVGMPGGAGNLGLPAGAPEVRSGAPGGVAPAGAASPLALNSFAPRGRAAPCDRGTDPAAGIAIGAAIAASGLTPAASVIPCGCQPDGSSTGWITRCTSPPWLTTRESTAT
jgi:hypothetical protein